MALVVRPASVAPSRTTGWLAAVVAVGVASAAPAQEPAAAPAEVTVRYRELLNREQFRFKMKDATGATKEYTRAVGAMAFEFPAGTFAAQGLAGNYKSFCIEPLTPMYAGQTYAFAVDAFGLPKDFPGIKNDAAGELTAQKRADFVRELYGRYYRDALKDDPVNAPAFQVALWELMEETEVPDLSAPNPFSLYTGSFTANYGNGVAVPAYVQQAQTYLQSLSGNIGQYYTNNQAFLNTEIVRLNGLATFGMRAQSQLAIRAVGALAGGGPGSTGGLALGNSVGGLPISGGLGGGGGGFGGGAIGFPFFPLLGGSGGGGGGNNGSGSGTGSTGLGTTGNAVGAGTTATGTVGNGSANAGTTGFLTTNGISQPPQGTNTNSTTSIGMNGPSFPPTTTTTTTTTGTGPGTGSGPGVGVGNNANATGQTGPGSGNGPGTGNGTPGGPGNAGVNGTPVPAPPGVVLGLGAVALMLLRRRAARTDG